MLTACRITVCLLTTSAVLLVNESFAQPQSEKVAAARRAWNEEQAARPPQKGREIFDEVSAISRIVGAPSTDDVREFVIFSATKGEHCDEFEHALRAWALHEAISRNDKALALDLLILAPPYGLGSRPLEYNLAEKWGVESVDLLLQALDQNLQGWVKSRLLAGLANAFGGLAAKNQVREPLRRLGMLGLGYADTPLKEDSKAINLGFLADCRTWLEKNRATAVLNRKYHSVGISPVTAGKRHTARNVIADPMPDCLLFTTRTDLGR